MSKLTQKQVDKIRHMGAWNSYLYDLVEDEADTCIRSTYPDLDEGQVQEAIMAFLEGFYSGKF